MTNNLASVGQLLAIEAAARHMSFQKAGDELNLSASAVSHRIRDFEALAKTVYFVRDIRKISLTVAGREQLPTIKRMLKDIACLTAAPTTKAEVLVATPSLFFSQIILPNLSQFQSQFPEIQLEFQVTQFSRQLNRFDAAIVYGKFTKPQWQLEKIMQAREVVVFSPKLINMAAGIGLKQLVQKYPLINLAYSPKAWQKWLRKAGLKTEQARFALTVNNMAEAINAAKAGLGIAIGVKELLVNELKGGELCAVENLEMRDIGFYLANNLNRKTSTGLKVFSQWLADQTIIKQG